MVEKKFLLNKNTTDLYLVVQGAFIGLKYSFILNEFSILRDVSSGIGKISDP